MDTETFETPHTPGPTPGPTPDPDPGPPARHPVNVGHLVMGVALAGLTVVWALVAFDVVADDDIRWLLPVPWVLAGVAGLVGLVAADRRRAARRRAATMEP